MNFSRLLSGVFYGRYDKTVHFFLSGMLTAVLLLLLPPLAAVIAALLAGIAKEVYDRYHHRPFDVGDLGANMCGVALAWFLWLFATAYYVSH